MRKLSLHSLLVAFIGVALILFVGTLTQVGSTGNSPVVNAASNFQATTNAPAKATSEPNKPPPTPLVTVGQSNQSAPVGIGDEYLALGDSVAYGVGAPTPGELGYAGILYNNYLKRAKPSLAVYRDLGIPGETSTSFFEAKRGKSQYQLALDVLDTAQNSGKVVSPISLTLGGNDMLDARGKSEAERDAALSKFEANLSRALDGLKERTGGKSDLIITTYYNPYIYQTGGDDAETAWVRRFNDSIRRLATERGVRVADFFTPMFKQEGNLTWIKFGDVHPNGAGYALLAQTLWQSSGYDRVGPNLRLSYNSLPESRKVLPGERYSFKLVAEDDISSDRQTDTAGAGSLSAILTLDNGSKIALASVPARLLANRATPEFTYILDSGGLGSGPHTLRFEATDVAGNSSSLELTFEVSG